MVLDFTQTPPEGTPCSVLWAKAGTPNTTTEVWCPATFVRFVGRGIERRLLVRSETPRGGPPVTVPAAPGAVRFAPAAASAEAAA